MKKRWTVVCLFFAMLTTPAFANDTDILKSRLNQVNSFYARFIQLAISAKGDIIQEGKGELWIKRPGFFHCHMTEPDESILVSDGKTLWFYNPFIKQVTANWLRDATNSIPFILITGNNIVDWNQYHVKKYGDNFFLYPKVDNRNSNKFSINITNNGIISSFTVIEQDGQHSTFQLKSQKNGNIDETKFQFILLKDMTLDDQRQ